MDVEREMGLDDIRRQLHNEEILRSLQAPQAAIDAVIKDTQATAQQLQQRTVPTGHNPQFDQRGG